MRPAHQPPRPFKHWCLQGATLGELLRLAGALTVNAMLTRMGIRSHFTRRALRLILVGDVTVGSPLAPLENWEAVTPYREIAPTPSCVLNPADETNYSGRLDLTWCDLNEPSLV